MAKVKYYYDSENLTYKKIKEKHTQKLLYFLLFFVVAVFSGFIGFLGIINISFLETPASHEIENMKLEYEIINQKLNQIEEVVTDLKDRDNNIYREYFNFAPVSKEEYIYTDVSQHKQLERYNNSELVINTSKRVDILRKQLSEQSKSLDLIVRAAKNKEKFLNAIPAIQPIKNESLIHVASGFGYRTDPFTKAKKFHEGMDFTAKSGTVVFATGDGVVRRADNTASGFGNHVVISHGFGYETIYAHLSGYKCRLGQRIKRGDIIGYVGSTGRSQAPHLHYEVHKDGKVVNPLNFYYGNISAIEYVAISKQASQENQSLD